VALLGLAAGGARAASRFYIRGGGDGHGIGMSQYGAYGYALHGADYRSILAHYYQGTQLGTISPQRTVRVLLATGSASFSGATVAAGGTGATARLRLDPATTYDVVAQAGGMLAVRTAAGRTAGRTAGSLAAPLTVTGPVLDVPGLAPYRGSLQFRPDGNGGVQTVNAVGLDDYVRGVVADEMPASWAPAALEAQAVAARTYAITTSVGAAGFDLYSDTRSQMYGGTGAQTPATDAAVAATSGQIVTYDGRPAVTYFFASSGGHTENIENVWSGATAEPWLRGVPDPYDAAGPDPYHSWSSQMSVAAAAGKLGGLVKGSLIGISVTRHGASPRILTADVVGTRGRQSVTGAQLQSIFGLATTDAAFTTISTVASGAALSGTVYPASRPGSLALQSASGGTWRTVAPVPISAAGAYTAAVPGPGRYRIISGRLGGPAVTAG
jgi:stage II sporulation protein D